MSKTKLLTKLDVIAKAVDHLLKQGRFAFVKTKYGIPRCVYDGKSKCAIGGLPGVSEAIKGFKHRNKTASCLYKLCPPFRELFAPGVDPFFLDEVQHELHDDFCRKPRTQHKIHPYEIKEIQERAEGLKRSWHGACYRSGRATGGAQ